MPTLEQLLADTQIADDVKIPFAGSEFTVKELRSFAAAQRRAVSDAEAVRASAQIEIDKAKALGKDALDLYAQAERMKAEGGNRRVEPRAGEIDWENDEVYGPVGRRFTAFEAEKIATLREEITKLREGVASGMKFVIEDYQDRRWNALPKDQRPEGKSWRDYMKDAQEKNIRDQNQLFDPVETYMRSTAADREANKLKEAEKRGEERAEKKLREANSLARPGSTLVTPTNRSKDQPQFKNLTEALNAAATDPEILRVAAGDVA